MLRLKYEIDREFAMLLKLCGEGNDVLLEIDQIIDDEELFRLIAHDFAQRYPHTIETVRNSTPVEVILRMLTLKHLRGLSYQKMIENLHESLILRQFGRIYFNPIPSKSTVCNFLAP